jgi:hypothetical protein
MNFIGENAALDFWKIEVIEKNRTVLTIQFSIFPT